MKNYIIICNYEAESYQVQKKLLISGSEWVSGFWRIQHTEKPVLVFDDLNSSKRAISYHEAVMSDEYKKHSCYKNHTTIDAQDFLNLRKF